MKRRMIMIALSLFASQETLAQNAGNDTYNFYFQKGSAPHTVIQGASGQQSAASPTAPPAPLPSQNAEQAQATPQPTTPNNFVSTPQSIAKEWNQPPEEKKYEIFLGASRIEDEVGKGTAYTFGGQYNFNRYLATRLLINRLETASAQNKEFVANTETGQNLWGGQAALVFTPIQLQLLGHRLFRLSAMGGVLSTRKFTEETRNSFVREAKTEARGFLGASLGLDINENVGLEASYAMLDGGKFGQANGNLVFRF